MLPPLGLPYLLLSLRARRALPTLHALPTLPSFPATPVLLSSLTALCKSCTCLRVFVPKTIRNQTMEKIVLHTCSDLFKPVHTSVTMYARRAMSVFPSIFPIRKLLFFSLTSYPAEFAYFSSPNRGLSNSLAALK